MTSSSVLGRIGRRALGALLVASAVAAGSAEAQLFTPAFQGPQMRGGVGGYLSGGIGGADGFALEGIARRGFGPFELGGRVGLADVHGLSLLVGLDYRNPIAVPDLEELDLAITGGAQALVGSDTGIGVSAGAVAGHTFPVPGAEITPYVHPRLALSDPLTGPLELGLLAEVGADFALPSDLRFHVALGFGGEVATLGIGVSLR